MVNYKPGVLAVHINKTTRTLVGNYLFMWNKIEKSGNSAIRDKLLQ